MAAGVETCAMGLRFHNTSKPRLTTPSAAIATAAVCQRGEGVRSPSTRRRENGRAGASGSCNARARSSSTEYWETSQALRRSRPMISSARYSSTCTGEALSQVAKALRSSAVRPVRLATNQSAASWAMRSRTCSSLALISSPQSPHATSAVHHRLAQVLLDHVRRDPEPQCDFLVTESLPVLHYDGGVAFRGELIQYLA